MIDPNIDLYTRHYYGNYAAVGNNWIEACRKEVASLKGQRPFFVGEFGPYIDGKSFTHDNVVDRIREFLDFVCGQEGHVRRAALEHVLPPPGRRLLLAPDHDLSRRLVVSLARLPQRRGAARDGHHDGDARGGVPDPRPAGAARARARCAELLPIGEVPLLSWRGSAGATGYDIERAPQADGPWTAIANNVSDADVAYRPLFSDTTARAGETWFYRVTARNASGVSQPSNVVGPVAVKRVCLADELQDFSRAHAKSDGLKLNNDYNALYAEYLFRAKATPATGSPTKFPRPSNRSRSWPSSPKRSPTSPCRCPPTGPLHGGRATADGTPSAQPAWRRRRRPAPHAGGIRSRRAGRPAFSADPLERPGGTGPS